MKNLIILELQDYKPNTTNLRFIWDIIKNSELESDIRIRMDSFFTDLSPKTTLFEEYIFFEPAMKCLVNNFNVSYGRFRVKDFVTNGNDHYKLVFGRSKLLYFDKINELKNIRIRGRDTVSD